MDPDPEIIAIRNDLSLTREQKIDAVITCIAARSKGPFEWWELEILYKGAPLEHQPLNFPTEEAARKALALYLRELLKTHDALKDDDEYQEMLESLGDEEVVQHFAEAVEDTTWRILHNGHRPEDPPRPGFAISVYKDGRMRTWEPEASRAMIARAYLD